MSSSLFNIGLSGLNAAQLEIMTAGHNIANASTPGYNRQQVVLTANTATPTGSGFIGQGVNIQTVQRIYSASLNGQLLTAQTSSAAMTSYQAQITQIDNLLADANAGLTPALSTFFAGVQQVSSNPADMPSRQAMLSGAQTLVSSFQNLGQQLSAISSGTNAQIGGAVSAINSYAQQLATVNQSIILAQASATGQPANDMLDQRDQIISNLSQQIGVSTVTQSDGSLSVFIGNGQPLVVGNQVSTLIAVPSTTDPQQLNVAIRTSGSGTPMVLQDSMLPGGTLGGLLSFRSQSLIPAQNALGTVALGLAQTFNDQHQLGQDLNGAPGGNFFTLPAPVVNNNALNTGSASLSATIVNSNYRLDVVPVTVAGVTTNEYQVTRLSDGSNQGTFAPNAFPVTVDGVTMSLGSGATTVGDSFVVEPGNPAGSRVVASSGNAAGAAQPDSTASNIQSLEGSDYNLTYSAANTFTLTRLSDNTSWTAAGANIAGALSNLAAMHATGVSLSLTGTPAVGDSFMIEPTRNAASSIGLAISNPSNIAVATPVVTGMGAANTGTGQISGPAVYDKSFLPLPGPVTLTYSNGVFAVSGAVPAVSKAIAYPATVTNGTSTASAAPSAGSLTVPVGGLDFTLALDGQAAQTVTVPAGTYATTSDLAAAIQTVMSAAGIGASISVVGGRLQVTSNTHGTGSSVVLGAGSVNPDALVPLFQGGGTTAPAEVDGTATPVNSLTVNINGMSFSINGIPRSGDTFTVGNNSGGVSDNSNALLLAQLQTRNTLSAPAGGSATASYQSSYSQLVAQVGAKANEVQVTGQGFQSLVSQAQTARDSTSAVNLDEEAANLMQYQQAYQAAAKIITVADTLFATLLGINP